MVAQRMTVEDLDWAVPQLAARRAGLVPFAPVYWRPAPDADQAHRRFLGHVLGSGGGLGFRTDDALMIAAPGGAGVWIIDDAAVPDGRWAETGRLLWHALAREVPGQHVRFVCPVPERERTHFARHQGLTVQSSWWHVAVNQVRAPTADASPHIGGATASLVQAPPVYDPGGPVLFLTDVTAPEVALTAARAEAERLGTPVVVVDQPSTDSDLGVGLGAGGFHRHCDFYVGAFPS